MNTKEFRVTIILMVLFAALILLADNTTATAQEDGDEPISHGQTVFGEEALEVRTVPGGPGFITIQASSLRPRFPYDEWSYHNFELYNLSTSKTLYASTPVFLPDGAVVIKVVFYFYDNAAGATGAWLTRIPLSGGGYYVDMAELTSASAPGYGYVQDTTILNATIDNQNYAYFIDTFIHANYGNELRITGIRIDYGYSTYMPTIMK